MEIEEQLDDHPFIPVSHAQAEEILEHAPTPDKPPFGTLEAMGLWIASVLLILIVPAFFLLPYLASHNPPITDPNEIVAFAKTDPTSIVLQIIGIIPAHLLTIALAWLLVTRGRTYNFREILGWDRGGFRWWHYAVILLGFMLMAQGVAHYFPPEETELDRMLASSRMAVYAVAFLATFTAPIVEEVVYRGVIYSAFAKKLGVGAGFVFATLLFAIVHVPQYWPSYSTIFMIFVLSISLTSIRIKTGNLYPCIVLHTIFNGLQAVFLIAEPYMPKDESAAFLAHFRW